MYSDVVTVFNRYDDSLGNITWYPTVIDGVNLQIDKAAIVAKYGAESKDNAVLNIRYQMVNGQVVIGEKPYLPPKEWERQTNDQLPNSITFTSGKEFDFFMLGDWGSEDAISEDYTIYRNGFYAYVEENYDFVFSISSVAQYKAIPHFEIMGA